MIIELFKGIGSRKFFKIENLDVMIADKPTSINYRLHNEKIENNSFDNLVTYWLYCNSKIGAKLIMEHLFVCF